MTPLFSTGRFGRTAACHTWSTGRSSAKPVIGASRQICPQCDSHQSLPRGWRTSPPGGAYSVSSDRHDLPPVFSWRRKPCGYRATHDRKHETGRIGGAQTRSQAKTGAWEQPFNRLIAREERTFYYASNNLFFRGCYNLL